MPDIGHRFLAQEPQIHRLGSLGQPIASVMTTCSFQISTDLSSNESFKTLRWLPPVTICQHSCAQEDACQDGATRRRIEISFLAD